jgi:hypothetical protein
MTFKSLHLSVIVVAFAATVVAFLASPASAAIISDTKTVNATSGPWLYSSTLNASSQYGTDSQAAPVLFSASDGFAFDPGDTLTITYLSGTVSVGGGFPFTDANGVTANPTNAGPGSSGKVFPSFFMNSATYPIYLGELVGTFADSSGAIVGTPFRVGDSASVVIPSGASRLQLGINDDLFGDNVGSYTVQVTGPSGVSSVPEPSTVVLLGCALAGVCLVRRRSPGRPIRRRA